MLAGADPNLCLVPLSLTTAHSCDGMVLSNEQAFSLPGWGPTSYPQFGGDIGVQEEFADDGSFPFEKGNFLF